MLLYIVRHGETDYNKRKIIQGSSIDSSLNAKGLLQTEAFYQSYKNVKFDHIYVSALKRTAQTVNRFLEDGIAVTIDSDLNEINWGVNEGKKSNPNMQKKFNELLHYWSEGRKWHKIKGGESLLELEDRISSFIARLKGLAYSKVLICSHGRTMKCMLSLLLEREGKAMADFTIANTGLFIVRITAAGGELLTANNTLHLNH